MAFSRRSVLQGMTALALCLPSLANAADPKTPPVPPTRRLTNTAPASEAFSFDGLIKRAETLAQQEYKAPAQTQDRWLKSLSYDDHRNIRFRPNQSYWAKDNSNFELQFFHMGAIFLTSVDLYEVIGGKATPISYNPSLFTFDHMNVPTDYNPASIGYAGFRVHSPLNRADRFDEFLVFLGASYFRAVGRNQAYGLSARGLALNTAMASGEEFPSFRSFWIEKPKTHDRSLTIYALLDSPSITGAYRFKVTPQDNSKMDVSCQLFARRDIERFGVAPLTSMYMVGENDRRIDHDFRPEVHDSDGLLIENSTGEWLWRPLINPERLGVSSFTIENPRGFGLMQRDRDFAAYEDLEALYEKRPSLWVEPKDDWGAGSVQLVEIPTDSEIHDNIVAYWVPKDPVKAGQKLNFDYTLSWGKGPRPPLGQVISTRVGKQFDHEMTKFVIDFQNLDAAREYNAAAALQPEISSSAGQILNPVSMPNPHIDGWRVAFDLKPDHRDVYELRCALKRDGRAITETWSYQFHMD